MATWKVGKHSYELVFDMKSWMAMEREVCTLDKLDEQLTGPGRLENALDIGVLLAKEGARLGLGEDPDRAWLDEHLRPKNLLQLFALLNKTMSEGMKMETGEDEEKTEAVDLALADIEKKDGPDA